MKYREAGRQQAGGSLYSVMAETLDTRHAKEVSQIQSQVAITHAHMTPQGRGLARIYNDVFIVRCHYWDYNLRVIGILYIYIDFTFSLFLFYHLFLFVSQSLTALPVAPCR